MYYKSLATFSIVLRSRRRRRASVIEIKIIESLSLAQASACAEVLSKLIVLNYETKSFTSLNSGTSGRLHQELGGGFAGHSQRIKMDSFFCR